MTSCAVTKIVIVRSAMAVLALSASLVSLGTAHAQTISGTDTNGGLVANGTIARVTTLADRGPGSLRAALGGKKPVVVIFDIGGTIYLESDLKIASPYVTIAGQSAPSPGITLTGKALRIRSHDVVIQHIAVRPGPAKTDAENDNQDSISIDGSPSAGANGQSFNVKLENVSASWSVDETISLWFPTTKNVTIRNSIISEALNEAGHPKGAHSMGLLVGTDIKNVEIVGNLFASNVFRNPAISQGASVYMANNYIYNPGQNGVHFYARDTDKLTVASFVNNVIEAGPNTKPSITAIGIGKLSNKATAKTQIFESGDIFTLGPKAKPFNADPVTAILRKNPFVARSENLQPAGDVKSTVLRYAGARPSDRDAVDRGLILGVVQGTARALNKPPMSLLEQPAVTRKADIPDQPFAMADGKRTRLEVWLCQSHLGLGGQPSKTCN